MWILECTGDLFDHKKIWLRPGTSLLLGRTGHSADPTERNYRIDYRGVSRKHLIISVAPPQSGDSSRVNSKTQLTITDDSKIGSYLDDNRFTHESKILQNDKHEIRLGNYEQHFKITWRPVVFSFAHSSKEIRNKALEPHRKCLEPLDIKAVHDYLVDRTTHCVVAKRNVPKVLQALLNARHVVTDAFVDAVVQASTSPGLAEDGKTPLPSAFETDFEANWPNASKFVPPSASEPNPRPSEFFAPDSGRNNLFDGFTFVFSDEAQYASLEPAIALGGAKSVLFEIKLGRTSVQDFCAYIRDLATTKGSTLHGESELKGVVVVRFRSKDQAFEQWVLDFLPQVDSELDQRSIEQNEFLDAILTKNPSVLRRGLLEEETEGLIAPPSTAVMNKGRSQPVAEVHVEGSQAQAQPNSTAGEREEPSATEAPTEQAAAPTRTRARWKDRRAVTQSRLEGFDDFDPSQISKAPQPSDSAAIENNATAEHHSQSLFVEDNEQPGNGVSTRKRPLSSTQPAIDPESHIDSLLPGSRALKKRRIEQEQAVENEIPRSASASIAPEQSPTQSAAATSKGKKKSAPNTDITDATRLNAAAMDRKSERSQLKSRADADMEDVLEPIEDIEELRKLAIVEEMAMPERRRAHVRVPVSNRANHNNVTTNGSTTISANGWQDAWNGRKNFKRFRRRGEGAVNRGQRVIVPVEMVEGLDFGIGPKYWGDESSAGTGTGSRKSKSQSQRDGNTQTQRAREESVINLDEEDAREAAEAAERVAELASRPMAKVGSKRPASGEAESQAASKRARGGQSTQASSSKAGRGRGRLQPVAGAEDSSSEEDGMKFRLRRR